MGKSFATEERENMKCKADYGALCEGMCPDCPGMVVVDLRDDNRDHDAHVQAWRAECAGYWDGEERAARRYRGYDF